MSLLKSLLPGFLICFSAFAIHAQYRLDNWTTDDGLPQNSVYAIVQTRDNYIWLATLDGLVRFDGVRFTVFNKSNTPGISNNRFVYLHEDANGDLWAGTEQSGIVRLHNGKFTSYGLEEGLTSLRVIWLSGDSDGHLVVYPPGMNPAVTWSGEKFVPVEFPSLPPPVPATSQSIFCGRNNIEMECFVGAAHERYPYAEGFPNIGFGFFYNSARSSDGSIWIPSVVSRLLRIDADRTHREYTPGDGLPDFPIRMITGGPRLNLLASDKNGVLWMTDVGSMQNQLLARQTPETLLKPVDVKAAFEDREGNTWFGTTRGGLFRARKQSVTSYSKADGLTLNNVYPIFHDSRGAIWIGTTLGGLFKYSDGFFSQVTGLPAGDINAIAEDHLGRLIFSVGSAMWTVENGRAVHLFDTAEQLRLVHAIYEQSDGTLWVGGQGGLARIEDGTVTYLTTKDGVAGDEVKVIIGDGLGGMWIGAYGGLTHYKDGQFKSWTEADGLPSTIRSLYLDSEGVLWIGTYDAGMVRFADGTFTVFNMKSGLYNDGVFQILEDAHRDFWISSNRGIYRVSKDELNDFADGKRSGITSIGYGKSDGMLNIECNGGRSPAGTKARDGRLWFPTQDGVAVIDPENITVNANPPPVAIEDVKIDNEPLAVEKLFAARQDPRAAIEIAPDQQNFEIEYTALSFINSENSRFKYKLEGLQDEWVDAGMRRTAYYSLVPPGDYTFRVIAANSDGVWNEEGKSIQIRVLPPFYKTWWFFTLAALFVGGFAFSGFRLRLNQLERARKSQEEFSRKLLDSQEQERQRIAAELHDSLGQSLLIIKNRIALAQSDIEERETVEEQLTELSHSATSAIDECRDIAYNLRPFQISRFGLSKTLTGIFTRINEVTNINATSEIEDIDNLLAEEAQTSVFRIVQECVNNIIKHSDATEASLTVKNGDGKVDLLIEDNGRGFKPDDKEALTDRKSGFGLIGIAERVKMLGGTYEIDSGPGNGTRVHIRLSSLENNGG